MTVLESWRLSPTSFKLSSIVVLIVLVCGLVNPLIAYDPVLDVDLGRRDLPPSLDFWLGTDGQGRSVATRLFKGVDAFFFPGLIAGIFAAIFGGSLGALCGYFGGWIGRSIATTLELVDTLPRMVFLVLICTIFPPSIMLISIVSSILFIPSIATIVRRKVEALGAEDYILAHVAHGFHPLKIISYHILWLQCRALLTRQMIFVFSYVLFIETALSYLGDYGVQEPSPSWGNMVAQSRISAVAWPWASPAIAIIITIAALLAFGDGVARREEEVKR
jgi:peptide/nickel transport system permease protein